MVNRYASASAWRSVDQYFASVLVDEDEALIAARESGPRTTMPNAEVAANQGKWLGLIAQSASRLLSESAEPFDLVFIDADKPSNPQYLAAALELTRPGAVIIIDNVVRAGAVVDEDSADPRVIGVRSVVDDIAANPLLDATAIQTVGEKGWDGFIIARRR